jgi:hypothetical protein
MFDTWNQALDNDLGRIPSLLRITDRPVQNKETRDALKTYRPETAQPFNTESPFRPGDLAFEEALEKR